MQSAAKTRRLVRLKQRLARSELRLARLRKQERAEDAHLKFRLGALTEVLGWDELGLPALEALTARLRDELADSTRTEDFRIAGSNWFERREVAAKASAPDPVPSGRVSSPAEMRARAHHLITIGGLFVRDGLDAPDRATLLGAMLHVDESCAPRAVPPRYDVVEPRGAAT